MNKIAQIPLGQLKGFGSLGLDTKSPEESGSVFTSFLSGAIGLMTVIALIWFIFNFMIGAIGIMTAGGDKAKVESSRAKITQGIIGIVLVIGAIFFIQLFASLIGVGDIILSPTTIIEKIAPGQ